MIVSRGIIHGLVPVLLALAPLIASIGDVGTRAGAAHRGDAPPPNVLLARARSEPAIALDPGDSRRLVAAANPDYYGLLPHEPLNGTFASADGGATWVQGAAPTYGRFTGVADPSLGADAAGHIYYLYMGETPSFCGEGGNVALLLARSDDGGRTFGPPTVLDVNPDDDKPFVAVGSTAGHTTVYATFTRLYGGERQILFMRSLDGGHTFSAPAILYASRGFDFGAVPVAAGTGRVYVIWAHYHASNYYGPLQASIMVRASNDGGRAFAPAHAIASFTGLPEMLVPGAIRLFTLPAAAVDTRGWLYVAWVRARPMARPRFAGEMDADVVLSRSRDGGRTWTAPLALNDTPLGDRFMPALSAGADGVVQVAFYDRRADHVHFALYAVAARDLWNRVQVWPNRRVSATLSTPYLLHYIVPGSTCVAPGRFMGDYIAAATSPDGALNVLWDDTALGHPVETDLWFSRVPAAYLHAGAPRAMAW